MKGRRRLLIALFGAGLAGPLRARAQPARKVPRVGFLTFASPTPRIPGPIAAFREAIRGLGYIEGQTIVLEFRWAQGDPKRLEEGAAELVREKVDVIVASGDSAIRAALRATRTIPIVMATSGDAVGAGFVESLARPGGNVTGMTAIAPELSAKRLQLIKELLPGASLVTTLWNPDDPVHAFNWRHMKAAEAALGVQLRSIELRNAGDFDGALARITRLPTDALVVFNSALLVELRTPVLAFAAERKLPAMYEAAEYAVAGGLMAYGVTHAALFRRSAYHVEKVLKGANPADLPVEQPTSLELVINRRTATALGIPISQSLLLRADRLVE